MKKLMIIMACCLVLIAGVTANVTLGGRAIDKEIPTAEHNRIKTYLIDKYEESMTDEEGFLDDSFKYANLPKAQQDEIKKMEVEISDCVTYSEDSCKFNAVLPNVIQSYDIVIPIRYCSEQNETTGDCITYTPYTDNEIATMQDDYVASRVEGFGSGLIAEDDFTSVTKPTGGDMNLKKPGVAQEL